MKILVVGQVFYPDNFRVNDIVKELSKENEVLVVTGLPDYDTGRIPKEYRWFKKRKEYYHNAKVIRVPIISRRKGPIFRSLNYFSYVITGSVYTLFLRQRYDVVFSFQTSPITMFLPGLLYAKKNKVKSVLYTLDLWPESVKAMNIKENTFFFRCIHKLSKWIYHGADVVLTSSPSFVEYLNQEIGLPRERISHLPQYTDETPEEPKGTWSVNATIQFMFAGNIGYMQDLETIVLAVEQIQREDFVVHIVGSGSNEEHIKSLVREKDLSNKVIFHGRKTHEEMNQLYSAMDVCLLTLKNEGYIGKTIPGKLQTYLAKGKAIAGAISNDTKSIIDRHGLGLCVESGDYEGLANCMKKYLEHPDLVREHSLLAYKFYSENFTRNIFMNKLNVFLKE